MKVYKTMDDCRDEEFLNLSREAQKEILWNAYNMEMFNLPESEIVVVDKDEKVDIETEMEPEVEEELSPEWIKKVYVFDDYGNGKVVIRRR